MNLLARGAALFNHAPAMPFEFLAVYEGLEDPAPEVKSALARALASAAREVAGDRRRFEASWATRAAGGRLELHLVIEVVRWRARAGIEMTVREARQRGWSAEVGDQLLLAVPYLPGQRAAATEAGREFGALFPALAFFDTFQTEGLPLLMRAYHVATRGDVPGLAAVPGDVEVGFRSRDEILRFVVAEGLLGCPVAETYDGLRRRTIARLDRCAQALVLARTDSFAWKHLVGLLVDVRPQAFHPYLAMLAPGREPEGRAFVGAPAPAVAPYERLLETAATAPTTAAQELDAGQLLAAGELHDRSRSTASAAGAAMLAVLRAGQPRALAVVDEFLRRVCTSDAAWAEAGAVALLADHAIATGADPQVVPIASASCFQVVERSDEEGTSTAHGLASGATTCSGCGKPLRNLFRVARSDLTAWARKFDLAIDTCPDCIIVHLDPYFVRYGSGGAPSTYPPDGAPSMVANEYSCTPDELSPRRAIQLEAAPPSRGRLSEGEPGCYARIGGTPSWLQAPRAIHCPRCACPMAFVGQTDQVPGSWAELILGFECAPCRIVGTTLERG